MAEKTNISLAKGGMNRSTHPSQLKEQDYTFAMNANLEDFNGDTFSLSNEHSNILASKFKEGFVVNGVKAIPNLNKTLFFLVNEETGLSEIGYIGNSTSIIEEQDIEVMCPECDYKNVLAQPLENIVQTPHQSYFTLLADCIDNPCLGLSTKHPVKKIEVKIEKTSVKVFFTDFYNNPRYFEMTNLGIYSYEGEEICSSTSNMVPTCLACSKLKMFRDFEIPQIKPVELILGGRIRMGSYTFLLAYSDELGNAISEYYSITNPIYIFDENNTTLQQENLADRTNLSIKLTVEGLDKAYSHYKVVVVQTADIEGAVSYFEEGIHTINDNTIIYSSEENKKRTDLLTITRQNIFVDKLEGITQSNNYLFGYGIEVEKELNLQPVVSMMGQFLRWQTHIAHEDLYKNGISNSLYLGINRDEVVPYGIKFYTNSGYGSSVFPFIARQATIRPAGDISTDSKYDYDELDQLNEDRKSIENSTPNCAVSSRTKRWQFYNDSKVLGGCSTTNIPTTHIQETLEKHCTISNVSELTTPGGFSIELTEQFYDLATFIEDNAINCEEVVDCNTPWTTSPYPFCGFLDINCYPKENPLYNCTPIFNNHSVSKLEIGGEYIIYTLVSGDNFSNVGYIESGIPFLALNENPIVWTNGTSVYAVNCETPIISNEEIVVGTIVGENVTKIEREFPIEYSKIKAPSSSQIYVLDASTNLPVKDNEFKVNFGICDEVIYDRDFNFSNIDCYYSDELQVISNSSTVASSYFHDYLGGDTEASLQTTKITTAFPGWTNKVHKGALWFKGNTLNTSKFLLELSKQLKSTSGDTISDGQDVRLSIFKSCTSSTSLYSELVDLTIGTQIMVEISNNRIYITNSSLSLDRVDMGPFSGSEFYVAIDNKIVSVEVPTVRVYVLDAEMCSSFVTKYRTAPTDGSFILVARDIEYKRADVTYTSISFDKKQTYTAVCNFEQPIIQKCKAVPFKTGTFGYYESLDTYPDNEELYDSSRLKIKPEDLPSSIKEEFETEFRQSLDSDGNYVWKNRTDGQPVTNYVCQPIRHFRFPDNKVSPFMYENNQTDFNKTAIYPLGVTIDENVINSFLDIAMNNGLLTKKQRDSIVKYEIVRGDISQDRSIQASGLLYDVRSYEEKGRKILYPNYPFNDLGEDKLNYSNKERTTFIQHPYNGESNDKFTFHSPETDYYRTTLPTEMSVQGYMFGKSKGNIDEVREHPKYVILTAKAKDLAGLLAGLEAATELAVKIAQSAETWRFMVGFANSANPVGIGLNIAVMGTALLEAATVTFGRYRYEWLKVFRDLGQPQNFANYYYSEGDYNYMKPLQKDGQSIRGLNVAKKLRGNSLKVIDENTGERLTINNTDREESVFISTGEYPIVYEDDYKNYDNNKVNPSVSSITFASDSGDCSTGKSFDIIKNIASPYVALKNFIPSQYGSINNIQWLSTGYIGDLKNPKDECLPIFGGDTFIGRHTLKRKFPLFLTDAMNQATMTPFSYTNYGNIGREQRFYLNFEQNKDFRRKSALFPDIDSDYSFDCLTRSGNYVKQPTKFYLYYYGVPSFLCESRVNTNYRYGKPELEKSFYPNVGDLGEWTQQINVPLKTPNHFYYNEVYSRRNMVYNKRTLADTYSKEMYDTIYDRPNGVMYSLPDNEENNLNEPWLIFKPLDFYEFPTGFGKLKELRGIESGAVLARFENKLAIYHAQGTTIEGIKPTPLGDGGMFKNRPVTFNETDLGYMGSQTSEMVSCEAGHFFTDTKRGNVFQVSPGGKSMPEEISSFSGNNLTGMSHWFKEHLPFKILKHQIPGLDKMSIDNAMNGVGITMGWDSRFKRIFLTKKDYIPVVECIEYDENLGFVQNVTSCDDEPQVPSCPEGYTFNTGTGLCEKDTVIHELCPEGYVYDITTHTCTLVQTIEATCICEANVIASPQTICSGGTTIIPLTSSFENMVYHWTAVSSSITGATSGAGNTISQTLTNPNYTSGTVTYTVTPQEEVSGCTGTPIDVVVTVGPKVDVIATPESLSVTSGDSVIINLTSGLVGTTFTWTVNNIGTTGGLSGSGETINQVLSGEGTTTYTITPTNGLCTGEPIEVVVTVGAIYIPCNQGMDVVFNLDYTGSMGSSIEAVKAAITTITDTIETESGGDYRLSLVLFDEENYPATTDYESQVDYTSLPIGQRYINTNLVASKKQYITAMELMSSNNKASFITQLNKINTPTFPLGSGIGTPEPGDMALDLIVNSEFSGVFRPDAAKIIVYITDAVTGGDDDVYNATDDAKVNNLIVDCNSKSVRILLMKSSATSLGVLDTLATETNGIISPSFTPEAIITAIQDICI